jgi:hypothetical protein
VSWGWKATGLRSISKFNYNAEFRDFTLYVPMGLNNLMGLNISNAEVTSDPARIFTASFSNGREIWPD